MAIIKLADHDSNNVRRVTFEHLIENAVELVKENPTFDKALIILVDTHNDKFDQTWIKSGGLLNSQAIVACHLAIRDFASHLSG